MPGITIDLYLCDTCHTNVRRGFEEDGDWGENDDEDNCTLCGKSLNNNGCYLITLDLDCILKKLMIKALGIEEFVL